jgi:ESF2/ABP1 family protein
LLIKDTDNHETESSGKKVKSQDEKNKKRGVIYLSKIPNKMNVKIIREYFSKFGDVDRIYLEPKGKL